MVSSAELQAVQGVEDPADLRVDEGDAGVLGRQRPASGGLVEVPELAGEELPGTVDHGRWRWRWRGCRRRRRRASRGPGWPRASRASKYFRGATQRRWGLPNPRARKKGSVVMLLEDADRRQGPPAVGLVFVLVVGREPEAGDVSRRVVVGVDAQPRLASSVVAGRGRRQRTDVGDPRGPMSSARSRAVIDLADSRREVAVRVEVLLQGDRAPDVVPGVRPRCSRRRRVRDASPS